MAARQKLVRNSSVGSADDEGASDLTASWTSNKRQKI
jgi:hypothetical protein